MNNTQVFEQPKYPAPFVAEVHFKDGSKYQQKHEKYFFRSDKISPVTANNFYLNYLETEKFVEREMNKTIVSAVIWNNTGVGKKKVYERTSSTILLPRQVSVDWFKHTFDKNKFFIDGYGNNKLYVEGFGQWLNEQFEIEQKESAEDLKRWTEVIQAYKQLLKK